NKKGACADENVFDISLLSGANLLNVDLLENSSKSASVNSQLDLGQCWHHVVVVRTGNRTLLYLDGTLRRETRAVSRVDILNNAVLGINISSNLCMAANEQPFIGLVDEIRVYDRALDQFEVGELFLAPDQLLSRDTTVFLGNSVDVVASTTCANNFSWTPNDNISDVTVLEPTLSPTETTTYTVRFDDDFCTSFDTLRVTVIDPDDLECGEIFLPKAFTPNDDGLNDSYGISNPYAIQELISLEIFDRWGGRVFATSDPFEQWDGRFKGQFMNPGVLLYRVRYRCDGEEQNSVGSLSILR
ncbi:MAG: gliding motility-associated C-terminal domain-containing protein, partial [Bacteroidota bacterium]